MNRPPAIQHPRETVRAKLVRTMIGLLSLVLAAVMVMVAVLHLLSARDTLGMLEAKIRESIIRKGQGLVSNHAQALRGLVADNAFSDVRRLVGGTVGEDPEIAYGFYVDSEMQAWAYVSPTSQGRAPARDAWKEVGIDKGIHVRPAHVVQTRQLFGQAIFEFAAPVSNEEGTRVGTIVYGAWSAPLETALSRARADSRRSVVVTSVFLVVLAAGAILVGWWLVRRAAALITKPIAELTRATVALAGGDRNLRVSIQSRDEIETLGHAFNQMVGELDESYARLEGLNHTLEERVELRTRELADRNRDLRLVLDTVDEGLLTIGRDGLLALERSAKIDEWFGSYTGETRFVDFISRCDPTFADRFSAGFDAMLEDVFTLELYLEQLPKRFKYAGCEYKCSYLPIQEGEGRLQGLLIMIHDITQQVLAAQQDAEQRELLALFQGFTRDRLGFLSLFEEATELCQRIVGCSEDLATHRRLIHTLKGNALLASLNIVAELCHKAEDELDESREVAVTPIILALRTRWERLAQNLRALQGDRGREVIEINSQEIDVICNELAGVVASSSVLERLAAWRNEPIERAFERLGDYGRVLAQRLGRGEIEVAIEAGGLRLDPVRWGPFWSEMVHIVRNAVDHGIESPDERRAAGKSRPQLKFRAGQTPEGTFIEVEDDGRGIDWEAIRRVARQRRLPMETEADLLEALLADGVSAKGEVSTTSGRGVGMAALASSVRHYGGQLAVFTSRGEGTRWRITFPASVMKPTLPTHPGLPAVPASA